MQMSAVGGAVPLEVEPPVASSTFNVLEEALRLAPQVAVKAAPTNRISLASQPDLRIGLHRPWFSFDRVAAPHTGSRLPVTS